MTITTKKTYTDKEYPWELRIDGKLEGYFSTKKQALANVPTVRDWKPSACYATRLNLI